MNFRSDDLFLLMSAPDMKSYRERLALRNLALEVEGIVSSDEDIDDSPRSPRIVELTKPKQKPSLKSSSVPKPKVTSTPVPKAKAKPIQKPPTKPMQKPPTKPIPKPSIAKQASAPKPSNAKPVPTTKPSIPKSTTKPSIRKSTTIPKQISPLPIKQEKISMEVARLITKGRERICLKKRDLAILINEKVQTIHDLESGRGMVNNALLRKIERIICIKLVGPSCGTSLSPLARK